MKCPPWSGFALVALSCASPAPSQRVQTPAEAPAPAPASPVAPAEPTQSAAPAPAANQQASSTEGAASSPTAPSAPAQVDAPTAAAKACRVHVVAADDIVQLDWLGVYKRIVGDMGSEWGVAEEPKTQAQARRASCWESSSDVNAPPRQVDTCEAGQVPWRVTTNYLGMYVDDTFYVWPLKDNRAVLLPTMSGGGLCPGDNSGTFIGHEAQTLGELRVVTETSTHYTFVESSKECVEDSKEITMWLYDLKLSRGFRAYGLTSADQIALDPKAHALTVSGDPCTSRVELANVPAEAPAAPSAP